MKNVTFPTTFQSEILCFSAKSYLDLKLFLFNAYSDKSATSDFVSVKKFRPSNQNLSGHHNKNILEMYYIKINTI